MRYRRRHLDLGPDQTMKALYQSKLIKQPVKLQLTYLYLTLVVVVDTFCQPDVFSVLYHSVWLSK